MELHQLKPGSSVYIIQRNPHTQSAAHIQEASIVEDPLHQGRLALFFRDEYFPLTDSFAMYSSYEEAKQVYNDIFSPSDDSTTPIQEVYD